MELSVRSYRRSRVIRLAAGLTALFILVSRLGKGGNTVAAEVANVFIWATTFLATVLLIWREWNQAQSHRRLSETNAHFMAAAETSKDAFLILDSVRNGSGDLVDFRYPVSYTHLDVYKRQLSRSFRSF